MYLKQNKSDSRQESAMGFEAPVDAVYITRHMLDRKGGIYMS